MWVLYGAYGLQNIRRALPYIYTSEIQRGDTVSMQLNGTLFFNANPSERLLK